ncbi:MAG: O-acetyl-ADP-ribose deacetylase [Clostridia bacterium]|nr:O-acetyl-ADP-ribose deacetylase [Clostridia bacterium]
MPIEIIRHDITKMQVDAIVNAANESLSGGGGVDGAIHRAAGPQLLAECRLLNGCRTGDAKITSGGNLPCRYVIHTVGPVWKDGLHGEADLLKSCYQKSLSLAAAYGCSSVAFPLISSGIYGYPKDQALRIATDTIRDYLIEHTDDADLHVYIVVFDKASFRISEKLYTGIAEYIDDHYAWEHADRGRRRIAQMESACAIEEPPAECMLAVRASASLEEVLHEMDESFASMVMRKIDEKGMTDPECYKKANLDRKLFSKLRKDSHYRPKKQTALALAVALELPLEEAKELLMKAGYALSHSDKGDIIVEYFIVNGLYDIFEINAALYSFGQVPLGGRA